MNTLNLIKKQIEKAAALHDAQISHAAYRRQRQMCIRDRYIIPVRSSPLGTQVSRGTERSSHV